MPVASGGNLWNNRPDSAQQYPFMALATFRLPRLAILLLAMQAVVAAAAEPVYIGLDEDYSMATSTSPKAIERGALAAIDEVNARGGVLGGRPLKLLTTNNQGVSARGRDNFIELASKPGMVAVLTGKFSPITVETLPEAGRLKVPLVSVWGSADAITDRPDEPSFTFRLSLKDSWGVEAMLKRAKARLQASRVCAILPNTAWGRSGERVINARAPTLDMSVVATRWYNWGDQVYTDHLQACVRERAQAIVLVANEREAALLFTQLAQMPDTQRLPVVSHWGITGGTIHELAAAALGKIDLEVIQTFSFAGSARPAARRLAERLMRETSARTPAHIPGAVGSAHAYDTVHLLALAVDKAGSTRGDDVRRALESLPAHEGVVRRYEPAFTARRHDALTPREVLFVRIERDGALTPVK
jgi:branched-chain amino acid transport system substrate-binding protein